MLKSWNNQILVAMDEVTKSHEKGKKKTMARASKTRKQPPPSTSSSSDVQEFLLPPKLGAPLLAIRHRAVEERDLITPRDPVKFLLP
uniref:Uncharacterized protein n=1 Tax=Cannabis sativa TaxID=3483 RepID=A0A803QNS4_CANSA